jgi:hypothetical protein
MATININEILGSDPVSGSRVTLNSNFLVLQNWINGYVNVFGIDTVNGILDLSSASTGRIQAKIGRFDSISLPSTGTATASINSSGNASFVGVQTTTFTASGALVASSTVTFGSGSVFISNGVSTFNGILGVNSSLNLGVQGHIVSQNTTYKSGATSGTAFDSNTTGGGGVYSSVNSPYEITGLEDVIYAECGPTGFYMKVVDGDSPVGGTLPAIPQGTRITLVNTSGTTGYIYTGVTGSTPYYTGFNVDPSYGGFDVGGLVVTEGKAYRSSVILQWEPRVGQGQATQNGSWVVLGSTNITV